jgi:hypothetical protein
MKTSTKLKLLWRYRRQAWKYRGLWKHRKTVAAAAATAVTLGVVVLVKRNASRPEVTELGHRITES